TEQDNADRLRAALAATDALQVETYLRVFLTEGDRTPRKTLLTSNFRKINRDLDKRFDDESKRLEAQIEKRRAVIVRDRTEALLHIATAAAANYRREKRERGLLDYDDLIDKT